MSDSIKVIEKEDGAHDVTSYHVHLEQNYSPIYSLGGERLANGSQAEHVRLHIQIDFDNAESATSFQAKVMSMLPEVRHENQ